MTNARRWVALAATIFSLIATALTLALPSSVHQASSALDREGDAVRAAARPAALARDKWTQCRIVLRTTVTVATPAGTIKECVASLPGGRVGRATLTGGVYRLQIVASLNVTLMRHSVQHEAAHLYEFSRPAVSVHVSKILRKPFFGAYPYNSQPQEIWAESVAACRVGRDPNIRIYPLMTCAQVSSVLRATGG